MSLQPTTYDQGIRQQAANLFSALILGEDNSWTGEDAYWGSPPNSQQGVTQDGRVYTLGLPNGTAPTGGSVVQLPTGLLLLAALVVGYVVLKG